MATFGFNLTKTSHLINQTCTNKMQGGCNLLALFPHSTTLLMVFFISSRAQVFSLVEEKLHFPTFHTYFHIDTRR